jgi:O-antigen biosynthesis protein
VAVPNRLEKQVAFMDAHPGVGLVGTGFMYIDGNNAVLGVERIYVTNDEIRGRLLTYNCFGHGTVMMRRAMFEQAGRYDESYTYAQDYDLWLRLAERCEVANLPEYLYCWRKTGSSVSTTNAGEQDAFAVRARSAAAARGILPAPMDPHHTPEPRPAGVSL